MSAPRAVEKPNGKPPAHLLIHVMGTPAKRCVERSNNARDDG